MQKPLSESYKVAVVTGASSGIGAEISKSLCRANVKVIAIARNQRKLKAMKMSLPKSKQKFFIVMSKDLTKKADLRAIVKKCSQEKSIDLLINNAGVGFSKDFTEHTDFDINQILATNLYGHAYITRELLKHRRDTEAFHIVFVSSLAGKMGFPQLPIYTASKFAIEGLCESLRLEYQDEAVAITVLRPGITDTNFFKVAGMNEFRDSINNSKILHPPSAVADALLRKLTKRPKSITVGSDKYFLKLLSVIPFKQRFNVLGVMNKL